MLWTLYIFCHYTLAMLFSVAAVITFATFVLLPDEEAEAKRMAALRASLGPGVVRQRSIAIDRQRTCDL